MIDLLKELDHVQIIDREAGRVEIEVPIPPVGLGPALRKLIRIAAQNDAVIPLARSHGPRRVEGDR